MKILVADDDFVSRTMLQSVLRKMGYEVEACENGAQALESMLRDDAPKMAVLDWMMPKLDGPDVIRQLRAEKEDYPYLILLTNRNETSDKVEGLESGADDYLVKPVNPGELKARVHVGERFLSLQRKLDEQSKVLINLERQQRASSLAQMAGGVAHHLNNKLQAVMGCLDLMIMEHPSQENYDKHDLIMLQRTQQAAEEAADIGKKMLAYLSQNHGVSEIIELRPLCQKVIDELLRVYPVLENMEVICRDGPVSIHANPGELREVIRQILTNALEADPLHAPRLVLETSDTRTCLEQKTRAPHILSGNVPLHQGAFAKITLRDKGPGIPREKIDQIFDPFMSTKFTGRGMGLPVCVGIVRKLGGAIQVSCPLEGGTEVTLCLPVSASESSD